MNSLRRWLYRPKRSDPSLLAQFYFADEELNLIAAELDGFEGRKDPERCAALVNQLRACQARVLNIVSQMMDESIKDQRALRDFRVKFPDDVIQENLAGQLWFGAECLAAGSSIMNREVESACMRPLARALTKNLDSLRTILREQCLHNVDDYTDVIKENLIIFDKLFAEFELSYVSAMVSVKTAHEYDMIQEITVLFSETVQRALKIGLLTQEMIDEYDPALMFTIPRLAIISGVLIFKDGPLNPDNDPWNISEMFRPFQTLLLKIRELLGILTSEELSTLERALCSQDEPSFLLSLEEKRKQAREERRKLKKERKGSGKVKNNEGKPSDGDNGSIESELTAKEIAERLEALALNFEATHSNNNNNNNNSGGGNNDTNGESVNNLNSASSDPVVNGDITVAEGLPSSSTPNGVGNAEHRSIGPANAQGLVVDLGCVEDLYREANLDSSDMITASTSSAYPSSSNDLLVQGIQMPARFTGKDSGGQIPPTGDSHSLSSFTNVTVHNTDDHQPLLPSNENSEAQDEVLADRDRFSLNKCDSNDSGLQSEVVSNSGSMFTISSSDSNQQILSSDSIPTPSSDQNGTDSSEDANSRDSSMERHNSTARHFENSSDSSATVVCVKAASEDEKESDSAVESALNNICSLVNSDSSQDLHNANPIALSVDSRENSEAGSASSELSKEIEMAMENVNISQATIVQSDSGVINDSDCGDDVPPENGACGNEDVSKDLSSDSVVSVSFPSVDFNHSHDEPCDKSNGDAQNATVSETDLANKCLYSSSSDAKVVKSECEDSGSGENVVASVELAVSGLSVNNGEVEETAENGVKDPDLTHPNDLHNETPSLSLQDSASDNPTLDSPSSQSLSVEVASNEAANPTKVEASDCAAEGNKEMPHSSESSTHRAEEPMNAQSTAAAPVNNVKNSHRKGTTSSGKAKSSKKRSKNGERRGHRHESGRYRPTLCPHHAKILLEAHQALDVEHSYNSSDTSSYTSECGDQEEIALAIEAAESATRNHVRARFRSSSDMIHRLFVCISGVADQLQTNFAGDLRNILRCVFDMNCPDPVDTCESDKPKDTTPLGAAYRAMSHASRTPRHRHSSLRRDPPAWMPDDQSNECMACQVPFNFLRRRHHCRNCGKIYCSRCSSNFVPLPHFGQEKAVRICNRCFMFQVTPFTTD